MPNPKNAAIEINILSFVNNNELHQKIRKKRIGITDPNKQLKKNLIIVLMRFVIIN